MEQFIGLLNLLAKIGIGYLIIGGIMGVIIFAVALAIIIKVFKNLKESEGV